MTVVEKSQQLLENFRKNKVAQLNELRKENEFCDLTLKNEDGFEIRVHKVVVSSASNYFKDMLTIPMRERNAECIPLPGISGEILDKIISFIYTSEFNENIEDIQKIVKHAVTFQLEELVEICSLALSESLNDYSCLNYWRLARDNLIYGLEDECLAYIISNADHLFENSFLNDLSIEEMRCLLANNSLHLQCDEQMIFEHVWKWAAGKVSDTKKLSEVLLEVVDLFRFAELKGEFLFARIFSNAELLDNAELLKKVAELTGDKYNPQDKDEIPNCLVFHTSTSRKLLGLGSNKMFIGLGEDITTIQKEKQLPDMYGYTTFANNFLLICGGKNSTSCEYLDPITRDWRKFPSMKSEKSKHECSYLANKIYACGGYGSKTVEIFDLDRGEWNEGPDMHFENNAFGLVALNGALYAIGGKTENVEILDPRILEWSVINSDFPSNLLSTRCVSIGPYIYCFTFNRKCIFDTRINKFIEDEEVSCEDFNCNFNYCELDGCIYGFGYEINYETERFLLKLVQHNFNGTSSHKETFGLCDINRVGESALVALYY